MGHKFKIAAIVSAAVLGIAVVIAIPAFLASFVTGVILMYI